MENRVRYRFGLSKGQRPDPVCPVERRTGSQSRCNLRTMTPSRPVNEEVRSYAPGTPERESLKQSLAEMSERAIEIPLIIGGGEVRTGQMSSVVMPHDH